MAEAFGVFAGSLELVGTVLKVRKLWKEVKDGPERVSDLLEEAEIVGRVLARVQESTLSEGARNPHYASCVAESALLCRRAVNSLHEIAELLDQKLNSGHKFRRKIAAVKTYLKKEDIGRLTQKLDRAVRLLCLANQSAQNAYLVANISSIGKRIEIIEVEDAMNARLNPESYKRIQGVSHSTRKPHLEQRDGNKSSLITTNSRQARSGFWYQSKKNEFAFQVSLPLWYAQIVWDIQIIRAISGWNCTIRNYAYRETRSPVFECTRAGNIKELQGLFDRREASLFDRTITGGYSLQHCALMFGRSKTSRFLTDLGLDIMETDLAGCPALRFSNYYPFQAPRNEIDDLCNMQVSKASDIDDADVKTCLSMLRIFANYLDSSQFKVVRDRLFPSYDSIPIVWRLAFSRSLNALATADRAAVFRHVITHDGSISKETLDLSVEKRMSLLHTALFYYGASRERFPQDDRDRWEALLYHFVRYSEDLNGVDTWQSWPILDYIFSDTICTDREKLQWTATPLMSLIKGAVLTDYILRLNTFQVTADRAVKAWLGILSYSGIDLERYGQREKQVFLVDVLNVKEHMACCGTYPLSDWGLGFINPSYNINCSYWANGPESHRPADGSEENVSPPLRLANFTYGPRPEDWQLRFEWCEEEWFGTFWDTVEHSDENQWNTFPVPGQWAE